MTTDLRARIMKHVKFSDNGCWEWTGERNWQGYGLIRTDRHRRVNRVVWEVFVGVIPEGMCVLHKCDNPPCVNPAHLFLGTRADNNADMTAKGRRIFGPTHPNSVLTPEQVRDIKRIGRRASQAELAREYGVCEATISHIATGRNWRWLSV